MSTHFLYKTIVDNKLFFSGLAIVGVILSHLIGVDEDTSYWKVFYPGFVGVDIFLFFSGYGLCRSLENNNLKQFYIRRFKRVYPLLVVFTLLFYALQYWGLHHSFSTFDVLCNLTTLSFWNVGGILSEWYMSFILYLYLLFPLLYRLVSKCRIYVLLPFFGALFVFLFFYRDGWLYQCATSRIPIFLFGIACYQQNEVKTYYRGMLLFMVMLVFMTLFFILNIVQKFELVYMAAPAILFFLSLLFVPIIKRQGALFSLFSLFGKYSLEIYLSNMLILVAMPSLQFGLPVALIYFFAHVVLVPILIVVNRLMHIK